MATNRFLLAAVAATPLLYALSIAKLPVASGAFKVVPIGLLVLACASVVPVRTYVRSDRALNVAIAAYVALIGIAVVRGAMAPDSISSLGSAVVTITVLTLAVGLVWLLARRVDTVASFRRITWAVALAPAVYVSGNVVLWAAGSGSLTGTSEVESTAGGAQATLLGLLGISAQRVVFPFAVGVNNFADVAAIGSVLSISLLVLARGRTRIGVAVLAFGCICGLLLTDARAAIVIALIAPLAARWVMGAEWRTWVIVVVPFMAPVLLLVADRVAGLPIISEFARTSGDLATANGRVYVWDAAVDHLGSLQLAQLYGYGAGGHATSGISQHYAYLFAHFAQPTQYTLHSFALQTIVDIGYLGLLIVLASWRLIASRLRDMHRLLPHESTALLAAFLVLVMVGITDGAPWLYTFETLLFVLILGALLAARDLRDEFE